MNGEKTGGEVALIIRTIAYVALGAAFITAYFPVCSSLVQSWASSEDNSHGFAIIPIALYMIWQQRGRLGETQSKGSLAGFLLVIVSLAIYVFAQLGEVLTLESLSMVTLLWGMVLFLFGFSNFKVVAFPLFFLLFMIPIPSQIYAALTIPLQLLVTKATAGLAGVIGIPIFRAGNVLHLPEKTLQVVQACSGMRSIMTMLTLGVVFGYFTLKSWVSRGTLILVGIPIAIAINVVRVLALVVAFHYFRIDLAVGTPHTLLGLGVFALAFGMFVLVQRGLAKWEK